jgi:hypothetical protein
MRFLVRLILLLSLIEMLVVYVAYGAEQSSVPPTSVVRLARAMPAPSIPAWGWLTLETPHFLVQYPPGHERNAQQIAVAAEEAHRTLLPKLQYLPEEKTHIVLADVSDVANGLTSVTPYNHIVIYPVFAQVFQCFKLQ